jgi:hypothetical protein
VARPAGEIRKALLAAIAELETPERGVLLREAAARGGVGLAAARYTIKNLHAAGLVRIARWQRVPWRNRPVAEYVVATPEPDHPTASQVLGAALGSWLR